MSGQLHTPAALFPRKYTLVPIGQEAGSQSRSGQGGEEKKYQSLSRLEPPIMQPVDQCYGSIKGR
jgi:hypothetical protein